MKNLILSLILGVSVCFGQSPVIVKQPHNVTYVVDEVTNIVVYAYGEQPLYYQWFKDGICIQGATNESLVFNPLSRESDGNYHARVFNRLGSVKSSNVVVLATETMGFAGCPVNGQINVMVGNKELLKIDSNAYGRHGYFQWFFNDNPIVGQTDSVLIIPQITTSQSGIYKIVGFNENSYAVCQYNVLVSNIVSRPIIVKQPVSFIVAVGGTARFSTDAIGSEPISYKWYLNDVPLNWATNKNLVLQNVPYSYNNSYVYCEIVNFYGAVDTLAVYLTVIKRDFILNQVRTKNSAPIR
jgi:hypothetical protein